MSEWPQYATVKTEKSLRETILVSPHDLTKELYEALKEANREATLFGEPAEHPTLARYEREVGK